MENETPVDAEAKMRLCACLGHANRFVMLMETQLPKAREIQFYLVRVVCEICGEKAWMGLTQGQWAIFQQDIAKGKVS